MWSLTCASIVTLFPWGDAAGTGAPSRVVVVQLDGSRRRRRWGWTRQNTRERRPKVADDMYDNMLK